jgi:hypothetical protein
MKNILKSIACFFEELGRARAAAELARAGKYEEAKRITAEKCTCC